MISKIKRRPFGNTGLYVSELSFGAMNLRRLETKAQAYEIVNFVLDQGINLIDTARSYSGENGSGEFVESERIVGEVIASRTDIDEPLVIVTKGHGYTPEDFDRDLATTLQTLGVKKTEKGLFIGQTEIKLVYFYHGIKADRWQTMTESNAIAHGQQVQARGDFTYLGFSSHYGDVTEIKAALDTGAFQVMELPYNAFNRSIGEDGTDMLKYAYDRGVAIVNMKAFNGNGMVPTRKIIDDVCSISYGQMLRFCLSNPYISTVDAGARYIAEFQADIDAAVLPPMGQYERQAIKDEADKISGLLDGICRECMHCLEKFECTQGINFPAILGMNARYSIATALGKDASQYKAEYAALEGLKADACVGCGACVEWCEYHLDIPALMLKSQEDLD